MNKIVLSILLILSGIALASAIPQYNSKQATTTSTGGGDTYIENNYINTTADMTNVCYLNNTQNFTGINRFNNSVTFRDASHSSAVTGKVSVIDENNNATIELASWAGGGGTGGYGAIVAGGRCSGANCRLGEISGKNSYNNYRLGDIIFETDSTNAKGRIVGLVGIGGGSFGYAFSCKDSTYCGFGKATPSWQVDSAGYVNADAGYLLAGAVGITDSTNKNTCDTPVYTNLCDSITTINLCDTITAILADTNGDGINDNWINVCVSTTTLGVCTSSTQAYACSAYSAMDIRGGIIVA